jgi:hypothetical protein
MDRLNGEMLPSEYELYVWMRHGADPYGLIVLSLEGLVADFTHRGWGKNHINKLILSLRKKRYLHYESRTGRRGSFQVHFPDFRMPNGAVSKIKIMEKIQLPRDEASTNNTIPTEETPENPILNQSLDSQRESISKLVQAFSMDKSRGSNNDTETKKEREINRTFEEDIREIPVRGFIPNSYEEQLCLEIALKIEEHTMNFLLGTHHKFGIGVIEIAWNEYKNVPERKSREIENKAKYFNGIVSQILMKQEKKRD